jgi:lanosterol synthase
MFLLPCVAIAWYVTETPIPWAYRTEIKNYLLNRANEDGGWGLHIEGQTTVLGTVLNYLTMRIVGVEADDPSMVKARAVLHKLGGALHSPHWGKTWMAVLGVADWDIVNPIPAELWLLPNWVPFAPWRWWIHIRMIFLPLSYMYSKRWVMPETELIRNLRKEMFIEPWEEIKWKANRNTISAVDNYHPKTQVLNIINFLLANVWRPIRPEIIKSRAEDWVSQLIDMEDENTDYSDLAPVSAPMNAVACYIRDGADSYTLRRHRERLNEFLWMNKEGMLCSGTNGVQCWDTSFALQAIVDADLHTDERWRPMLLKALNYLDKQQIRDNVKDQAKCYRHQRKGGWAFSNKTQGYAVSDCISEALKAIIMLQKTPGFPTVLEDQRIFDAVDTLLTYQNSNGGVCSYELQRAGEWMEWLNAAEVFGRIMVEYHYPECTTAVVTALCLFRKHWPDYRTKDLTRYLDRAVAWIKTDQRKDGSWYGSWGICFTYAGMFALESLASHGEFYDNSEPSRRGCEFFVSKQRADGGWSESFKVSLPMDRYHDKVAG